MNLQKCTLQWAQTQTHQEVQQWSHLGRRNCKWGSFGEKLWALCLSCPKALAWVFQLATLLRVLEVNLSGDSKTKCWFMRNAEKERTVASFRGMRSPQKKGSSLSDIWQRVPQFCKMGAQPHKPCTLELCWAEGVGMRRCDAVMPKVLGLRSGRLLPRRQCTVC